MPVMIDEQKLEAESLGFLTVGQVLAYVRRQDRLVVNLLIDGRPPDLSRLAEVQKSAIGDRAVFVETSSPADMATEVLAEVESGLSDAEFRKVHAAELLQQDRIPAALDQLRTCFTVWQAARDSVEKTAELLGLSADSLDVDGRLLPDLMSDFSAELRSIRQALQDRDYVLLADLLMYETNDLSARWSTVIATLRSRAAG